jgi:hypothetical protein
MDYRSAHPPARSVWAIIGIIVSVLLALGGLAVVGFIVLLYVGLSHFGGNK